MGPPWLRPRPPPLLCLLLRLLLLLLATTGAVPTQQQFLHLSDLHWDPYYGTADGLLHCTEPASPQFGKYGCDSPERLVRSAIAAAKAVLPDPAFIVVTGDFVRHAANRMPNSSAAALTAVASVTRWVCEAFGSATPVVLHHFLPALGNNDVVPDYEVQVPPEAAPSRLVDAEDGPAPGSATGGDFFLEHLADVWRGVLPDAARDTFRKGGFYAHEVIPGLFVLSLNTVVYSPYHEPDTAQLDDPYGQFWWMGDTLAQVRQEGAAAYIIGHIPPVEDSWGLKLMWVEKYIAQYLTIVERFSDVVRGQLYGHVHAEDFRTFEGRTGIEYPLFMVGSVTPIYHSNPSFRVWNFSLRTKELLDFTVWHADLDATDEMRGLQWEQEYSAVELFGLQNLSNTEFHRLATQLETDDALWHDFLRVYYGGVPFACDAWCRREMVCLFLHVRERDFELCVNASNSSGGGAATEASPAPSAPAQTVPAQTALWQLRWWIAGAAVTVCLAAAGAAVYFRKSLRLHISRYRPMRDDHPTPAGADPPPATDL